MQMEKANVVDCSTRLAVEDLIHAIARAIDDDDLEEFPGFFLENARYRVASRYNLERGLPMAQINCTNRGMIADRVASLRHANIYPAQRYRHLISGIHVRTAADGSIDARSSYLVLRILEDGSTTIFSSGEYQDRIVMENGIARLSDRHVIFDSKSIESLLVIPI